MVVGYPLIVLQLPHVDKDTILTLEHAERLVNSFAI